MAVTALPRRRKYCIAVTLKCRCIKRTRRGDVTQQPDGISQARERCLKVTR